MTFEELYKHVLKDKLKGKDSGDIKAREKLDCLLHPEKYPLVWKNEPCDCDDARCVAACMFQALEIREGKAVLNPDRCTGCAACIEACGNKNLSFSHDTIRAVELLKNSETPVYVLMAPAYIGQFGEDATPGRLRSALKGLGAAGMIEVAAFADILTLKESLEFCTNTEPEKGFQLTSCCCPIWISMIRKDFQKIAGHLPASVSPMIACGRIAKELHEGCITIFVGPCMAKKAESREPDLEGAIDCVLTFEELQDIWDALEIDFSAMPEDNKEHSAAAGRMYARTGGVSRAVSECVSSIDRDRSIRSVCACGVPNCKAMLQDILDGDVKGNFFEGMGCDGGCVGGPKRNIDKEAGTRQVDRYAEDAAYRTPGENPYAMDLIQRLGYETVEDFVKNSRILTREF